MMKLSYLNGHAKAPRLALLPAVSAGALILTSCGAPTAVTGIRAELGPIASTATYSATVAPQWTVSIVPDTAGKIVSLNVKLGQSVRRGEAIAELDKGPLQDALAQADAGLVSSQAKLDGVQGGARPEDVAAARATAGAAEAAVSQAQAGMLSAQQKLAAAQAGGREESIKQARAKLDADQATLDKLRSGPTAQEVVTARLAVEQAKARLYADQTQDDALVGSGAMTKESRQAALGADQVGIDQANSQLANLLAPARPQDIAQAQAAVEADQQAVELATQPNRPEDIAQLQQAVAAAQGQVAQTQQQAASQQAAAQKAASPYTAQDLAQAQAAVQSAQAGVQVARRALANATVAAPADGIISEVNGAVGALASPTGPIASEIASQLEVDASVGQDQVGHMRIGQPASIVAGCDIVPGHLTAMAPAADPKLGTYAIKIAPDPSDISLRAGMSVTVQVETAQAQNAIVVPASAVETRDGRQVVFKVAGGRASMTAVQLGLTNAAHVQVTAGLQPDDVVLLAPSSQLADGQSVSVSILEPHEVVDVEGSTPPVQPACKVPAASGL